MLVKATSASRTERMLLFVFEQANREGRESSRASGSESIAVEHRSVYGAVRRASEQLNQAACLSSNSFT